MKMPAGRGARGCQKPAGDARFTLVGWAEQPSRRRHPAPALASGTVLLVPSPPAFLVRHSCTRSSPGKPSFTSLRGDASSGRRRGHGLDRASCAAPPRRRSGGTCTFFPNGRRGLTAQHTRHAQLQRLVEVQREARGRGDLRHLLGLALRARVSRPGLHGKAQGKPGLRTTAGTRLLHLAALAQLDCERPRERGSTRAAHERGRSSNGSHPTETQASTNTHEPSPRLQSSQPPRPAGKIQRRHCAPFTLALFSFTHSAASCFAIVAETTSTANFPALIALASRRRVCACGGGDTRNLINCKISRAFLFCVFCSSARNHLSAAVACVQTW